MKPGHKLGQRLRHLKRDVVALWLAARHPGVPWYAKLLAGGVAAYALSPIDLVPDVIPVLGYLDDALIVPAGVWLQAAERRAERPTSWAAATVIVLVWLLTAAGLSRLLGLF